MVKRHESFRYLRFQTHMWVQLLRGAAQAAGAAKLAEGIGCAALLLAPRPSVVLRCLPSFLDGNARPPLNVSLFSRTGVYRAVFYATVRRLMAYVPDELTVLSQFGVLQCHPRLLHRGTGKTCIYNNRTAHAQIEHTRSYQSDLLDIHAISQTFLNPHCGPDPIPISSTRAWTQTVSRREVLTRPPPQVFRGGPDCSCWWASLLAWSWEDWSMGARQHDAVTASGRG